MNAFGSRGTPKQAAHVAVPRIGGPFVGVLVMRSILYWGQFWGPLFMPNPRINPLKHEGL